MGCVWEYTNEGGNLGDASVGRNDSSKATLEFSVGGGRKTSNHCSWHQLNNRPVRINDKLDYRPISLLAG